jgi:hypothetical protein
LQIGSWQLAEKKKTETFSTSQLLHFSTLATAIGKEEKDGNLFPSPLLNSSTSKL